MADLSLERLREGGDALMGELSREEYLRVSEDLWPGGPRAATPPSPPAESPPSTEQEGETD